MAVGDPSLEAQFVAFDAANPAVYREFKRFALQALQACHAKNTFAAVGAKAVWERMRWEITLDTSQVFGKDFKLNNDYVSRYARKLAAEDARFLAAFKFRKLKI